VQAEGTLEGSVTVIEGFGHGQFPSMQVLSDESALRSQDFTVFSGVPKWAASSSRLHPLK
jgi:hypothetical protein